MEITAMTGGGQHCGIVGGWAGPEDDAAASRHLSSANEIPANMSTELLGPGGADGHSFPTWTAAPPSTSFPKPTRPHYA